MDKNDEQKGVALLSLRMSTMTTTFKQAAGERALASSPRSLIGEEKPPPAPRMRVIKGSWKRMLVVQMNVLTGDKMLME